LDRDPREILIIKPSSLGDVVHTLPAVALVKRRWPDARVRWLINPEWAPLLEGNPHVDEAIVFPRQELRGARGFLRIAPWARQIRQRVPADLLLDFQGLLRSALIARLCCVPGGRILGLSDAREGAGLFYHRKADVGGISHAVDRYLALVSTLGIPVDVPLEWPLPFGQAPAGFAETKPFILLHPFSRGAGKSLSPADVGAFCRALGPVRVVLVGRSDESVPPSENVENLLNRTTLPELIWLIRRAAYVVSVDSGPMHIAAALTSRLVSIHTWSDPAKVGPYRSDAWVWKDGSLFQMKNLADSAQHTSLPTIAGLAAHIVSHEH
jgi:ADP-heptose:LPS heptosyltransferase